MKKVRQRQMTNCLAEYSHEKCLLICSVKKRQSSVVVNKFGRKNKWRNKWLCFLDFVFGQHRTYYSNIIEDQLKSISIFTIRYDSFCIALDFEINSLNFNSDFFTLNVGVKKTIFSIIMSYMSLLKQLECDNIYF